MSCFCQAVMSVYLRRWELAMRHEMSKSALERHEVVSQINCQVPSNHIPIRSWPLFRARKLLNNKINSQALKELS
jgi:hypothetical protein